MRIDLCKTKTSAIKTNNNQFFLLFNIPTLLHTNKMTDFSVSLLSAAGNGLKDVYSQM